MNKFNLIIIIQHSRDQKPVKLWNSKRCLSFSKKLNEMIRILHKPHNEVTWNNKRRL
jgi:hypothetical protein